MKEYAPFLAHQLARFGVLTVPQMLGLCDGRCKKSSLYRLLARLKHDRYIVRTSHPTEIIVAYCATRSLYSLVYGKEITGQIRISPREFEHSIECANAIIELSRYSNVSGVATEHEFGPEEARVFCHNRIPDGIVQITRGDLTYELALEVEHSVKSEREVAAVLASYRQTLTRNMPCAGVVIVAGTDAIHAKYLRRIAELPKEIEERILLTSPVGLMALNPEYFGPQSQYPGRVLENLRSDFQGHGKYMPMKTKNFGPISPPQREPVSLGGSDVGLEVLI